MKPPLEENLRSRAASGFKTHSFRFPMAGNVTGILLKRTGTIKKKKKDLNYAVQMAVIHADDTTGLSGRRIDLPGIDDTKASSPVSLRLCLVCSNNDSKKLAWLKKSLESVNFAPSRFTGFPKAQHNLGVVRCLFFPPLLCFCFLSFKSLNRSAALYHSKISC